MSLQVSVIKDEVTNAAADVLLLKHARQFYGADEAVAERLALTGVCQPSDLAVAPGKHRLVETAGAISAHRALFLGTDSLRAFRYSQMRQFAKQAIEVLSQQKFPVETLATTVHGAGYGLDIEEALRWLILGFQQGLITHPLPALRRLVFVERNARRFEVLNQALADVELVIPQSVVNARDSTQEMFTSQLSSPPRKKIVFVAMPFGEEFEDIYQFGIYNAVRRMGYVCEKVDQSMFTGSIVEQITSLIKSAEFIVADLSAERPNVYLEVGFAWGLAKPVILVAREGQQLHFDLSHHKCLFYRTIGKLADSLSYTIQQMFGPGDSGEPGHV
jgi:hypothetical protein